MDRLLGGLGAIVGGSLGWWAGARGGVFVAFAFGMVGTGAGLYLGRRVAERLLE